MTFGAFDLLHYGHYRLFKRISALAERLTVALATDEVIRASGWKIPIYSYAIRKEMLEELRVVDDVVAHDGPIDGQGRVKVIQQKIDLIQHHNVDLVVMGEDWLGDYDFLEPWCTVMYLPRTPGISTTDLKQGMGGEMAGQGFPTAGEPA